MTVGIIGLGLIGGSMGLALQKVKFISTIYGYDKNEENLNKAFELGLIHHKSSFEEIKKCDIIFLAIPVEAVIKTMKNLVDIDEKTTIIDLGSTKAEILANTPQEIRANFIAAHPMAGTEHFGPTAAFYGLFKDAVVVLCDFDDSGDLHKNRAVEIFSHIGMKIAFMDAKSHDHHAAVISHLPHAISYALANSVIKQESPKNILLLAGGSFADMSRIAKSSPTMWSDVFKQNKENLLDSIDRFREEFLICRKMIEDEKWQELHEWMQNATTLHKIL